MDRRTKYNSILIIWLAAFFLLGFGVWSFQAGHLMILAYLFLTVIMYVFFAFLARCPQCRARILLRPMRIFGMELYRWSILMPARCMHCGAALS